MQPGYRNALTLSAMLREAFMDGAGYEDGGKISVRDQERWLNFEPSVTPRTEALMATLRSGVKHPQDMSLNELFDHVAIVNDAIRAALANHPGFVRDPARR